MTATPGIIDTLLRNADWIAGLSATAGSLVLAWPLLQESRKRRRLEALGRTERRDGLDPEDREDLARIGQGMIRDMLGGYRRHRRSALTGIGLLVGAGLLLLASAVFA